MKTRFIKMMSVLLTILMLGTVVSAAYAAGPALAGADAASVEIADAAGLAALAANPAGYDGLEIVLSADINLSEITDYVPIGTQEAPFKGKFDGCGHTIIGGSGFNVYFLKKDNTADYGGLFGYASGAEIKNVTLSQVAVSCNAYAGCLLGYGEDTTISNVIVKESSSVEANENAGGIVGYLNGGEIADCRNYSSASTAVKVFSGDNAGGIVGKAVDAQILRCVNKGVVFSQFANCGGIVGSIKGTVSHCLNTGNVTSTFADEEELAPSACVAGIAGEGVDSSEVTFCGNTGKITSTSLDCYGTVGYGPETVVSDCYSAGVLDMDWEHYLEEEIVKEETNCVIAVDETSAEALKEEAAYDGWDFENTWLAPTNAHNYPYPTLADCNFHEMEKTVTRPVSCTENEKIRYSCMCGYEYYEEVGEALGHKMEWITTHKPTCVDEGEKVQQCTRLGCGYTDESTRTVIPATGEHVDDNNDNACDVCGTVINEPEQEQEVKKSFFQKIIDFFKRIIEWIKNLFKRDK